MSKYTTEVRYICENAYGLRESEGYSSVNKIIQGAIPKIFDFDFPIFDESYRNVLCTKILKHNYTREIGFETVGLWKLKLDTKLNEIMPYYNQLYKSELLEFNPLYDMEVVKDYTKTADEKNTNTQNVVAKDTTTYSGSDTENGTIKDGGLTENNKKVTDLTNKDGTVTKDNTITESSDSRGTASSKIESTGSTETNSESEDTKWKLYSDTPQGGVDKMDITTNNYLTNATKDTDELKTKDTGTSETSSTDNKSYSDVTEKDIESDETTVIKEKVDTSATEINSTINNNTTDTNIINTKTFSNDVQKTSDNISTGKIENLESYFEKIKGKTSGTSYSKMLQEFRETFLNIDNMILEELNDLFMLVW